MRFLISSRLICLTTLSMGFFVFPANASDSENILDSDSTLRSGPPPSGLLNSEPTEAGGRKMIPGGVPATDEGSIQPIGPGLRTVPDAGWGTMTDNEQKAETKKLSRDHLEGPTLQASFMPSIWNDNYRLGLGLDLGGRAPVWGKLEAGGDIQYTWFRNKTDGYPVIHELGLRAFAVHPLPTEAFFAFKLGAFVGTSRLRNKNYEENAWHLTLGGIAEVQIPLIAPYGLLLSFSPGYALGDLSGGIFRLGFGMQYAIGK